MKNLHRFFLKFRFFVFSLILLAPILSCSLAPETVNYIDSLCKGESLEVVDTLETSWTQVFEDGVGALPVVSNGVVVTVDTWADNTNYPATVRNKLVGSDLETGKVLWTYSDAWESWISLLSITDQNIALQHINPDHENKMVLLSLSEGEVVREFPGWVLDLLVTPHHLFMRPGNRATVALSLETGQEVTNIAPKTIDANKQFTYVNGVIYSVYGNELTLFRDFPFEVLSSSPLLRWNRIDQYDFAEKFFVFDQRLIAIFPNGLGLYQVDEAIGATELWNMNTEQYGRVQKVLWPPAIVDNQAYLFNENGVLTEIDLQQGQLTRQIPITDSAKPDSTPVLYHGKLYAVFADGTLRSFTLPDLTEHIEIQSSVIRNYDNESGEFHVSGVAIANDMILVSFGCKNLYALQAP